MTAFRSGRYWEQRYRAGGHSGAGSCGRLLEANAALINGFVADNAVADVLDLGCGDGSLLGLLQVPAYVGVDVSATALQSCAARYPQHRFLPFAAVAAGAVDSADLVLSVDVIFHLVEDSIFMQYMHVLLHRARRFVLIHSSNVDSDWPSPHVRHRRFTDYIADCWPEWRLLAHLPNRYPYDPAQPDTTSFADFFVFGRAGVGCRLRIP